MFTPVSANALSRFLVTNHVMEALAKFPRLGPSDSSLSHHSLSWASFPAAMESSAYHTCLQSPSSLLMRGIVANPYMAIAKGSPCVVPSCERMTSPSMKSSVGQRYELISNRRAEMPDVV